MHRLEITLSRLGDGDHGRAKNPIMQVISFFVFLNDRIGLVPLAFDLGHRLVDSRIKGRPTVGIGVTPKRDMMSRYFLT